MGRNNKPKKDKKEEKKSQRDNVKDEEEVFLLSSNSDHEERELTRKSEIIGDDEHRPSHPATLKDLNQIENSLKRKKEALKVEAKNNKSPFFSLKWKLEK